MSSFAALRSSDFLLLSNFCNNNDFSPFKIDILLVSFFEAEDFDCGVLSNNKSYNKINNYIAIKNILYYNNINILPLLHLVFSIYLEHHGS